MSGYCPDCGNTLCLCKSIAAQEAGLGKTNDSEPKECSVELTCDGGIWNCMRHDLEKELAEANARLAQRHIVGKAYEITRENINRLASELEETKLECDSLKATLSSTRLNVE